MELIQAQEEEGVTIPSPYERTIRILMAPDKRDVSELMLSHVEIPPGSGTDYHDHDRPELIYVLAGTGVARCDGRDIVVGRIPPCGSAPASTTTCATRAARP